MKNQVLSIEQMQKLKELGADTSKASMHFLYMPTAKSIMSGVFEVDDEPEVFVSRKGMDHENPVFTLQDIIELLQGTKSFYFRKECENFYLKIEKFSDTNYSISYENSDHFIVGFSGSCLLTCAYNMLIWVAENGYLTSK